MPDSLRAFVLENLDRTKFRWPAVAAGSGVSIRTIRHIGCGRTKDPRLDTVEKLATYFREQAAATEAAPDADDSSRTSSGEAEPQRRRAVNS